jgi:hypothetical protein
MRKNLNSSMYTKELSGIVALALLSLLPLAGAKAGGQPRSIGRTTEKALSIVLSSSFGTVVISKGEPGTIYTAEPTSENGEPPIHTSYSVRNRVGYLEISLGEGDDEDNQDGHHWNLHGGKWDLRFCNAIPVSFDIELGVGTGDLDLSGLQIKDFTLSTGASEVVMRFDEENSSSIEHLSIESGVAKFTGLNLSNANFKDFHFEGGVGTYYLDFGGKLAREVDVDVEVGLGVLTMVVPPEVGAKLSYEKNWISRLDCDKDFENVNKEEYITDNYNRAAGRMNIRIESGLGSVRIRRR